MYHPKEVYWTERSLSRRQMDGDLKVDWRIHWATFWREWLHKKKALTDTPEDLNIRTWKKKKKKKCVHQHQLQRRSLPKRARGLYYIKCQETSKEVNFLEDSLLPPIMKKSQLKDELPTKQNCIIIYCMQQTALASLLLVESLSGNTTGLLLISLLLRLNSSECSSQRCLPMKIRNEDWR